MTQRSTPQRITPIRIVAQHDQAPLSKGQKTFNTLVKKIETSRKELAQWQAVAVIYQQKVAQDFVPLLKRFQELQAAMVHGLDQALDAKGLTKSEQRVVQGVLCEVAQHLIGQSGDEQLKAIYNKHSPHSIEDQETAAANRMKEAMQEMFGIDLGVGTDVSSPEELLAQLKEQMGQVHQRGLEEEERRSRRKKTPKQEARAQAAKTEADQTSLSIREVYRKLASALHPDREPDLQERARKTALMQRVNQAYDKKDLLQLLELQLELEHIDAHAIAALSEDRLKHFNKILSDQLRELMQEIMPIELALREQLQMEPYLRLTPQAVIPLLERDVAELRRDIPKLEQELLVPQNLVAFKQWIKARRRENQARQAELRRMQGDDPNDYYGEYQDDCPF
jgi:hypothetical protein